MIEYIHPTNGQKTPIEVKLSGKKVGRIISAEGGFQYIPSKSKKGGEIYATIKEVKQSLEE